MGFVPQFQVGKCPFQMAFNAVPNVGCDLITDPRQRRNAVATLGKPFGMVRWGRVTWGPLELAENQQVSRGVRKSGKLT